MLSKAVCTYITCSSVYRGVEGEREEGREGGGLQLLCNHYRRWDRLVFRDAAVIGVLMEC